MNNSPKDINRPSQLWITTNSPGELSSWVTPLVRLIQEARPTVIITIALVPCQYSSGHEYEIASRIPGVSRVLTPSETIRYLFGFNWPHRGKRGAVLCLGGDPMYAKGLGWVHDWPVIAYSEHEYGLGFGIKTILRKSVIGDLMASRIAMRSPSTPEKQIDVVFFTGSRPNQFDVFAPFVVTIARQLRHLRPQIRLALQRSLFIDDDRWDRFCATQPLDGIQIATQTSLDTLATSRLMISLPGTSTAEAMYMGTPMMVLVPLNRLDLIQMDGLLGIIGSIPWLGTRLKKLAVMVMKKQNRKVALPNMIARREIVPELVGVLDPDTTALRILSVLESPETLAEQRREFDQFKATTAAADRIVAELCQWI